MAEASIKNIIIALVVMAGVTAGLVGLIASFMPTTMTPADNQMLSGFNETLKQNTISNTVGGITSTFSAEPDFGVLGVLNSLIQAAWNSLRSLVSGLGFVNLMFTNLAAIFGVPTWVVTTGFTVITVIVAFAIFGAIFQKDL